jgi:hypothetical protein
MRCSAALRSTGQSRPTQAGVSFDDAALMCSATIWMRSALPRLKRHFGSCLNGGPRSPRLLRRAGSKQSPSKPLQNELSFSQHASVTRTLPGSHSRVEVGRYGNSAGSFSTSSVHTLKLVSVFGPNVLVIATSTASRPRAISTRPVRGILLRGSKTCQEPSK